jgi:hypothetical protein
MLNPNNNGTGMVMNVVPAGYGNGGGMFGGDGGWGFLWLIALMMGWGGFGGMGGGAMMWPMMMGGGMGGWGMNMLYPWMQTNQNTNDGFRDLALQNSVDNLRGSVDGGFRDVLLGQAGTNQAICQSTGTITGAVRDSAYSAEIAANGRQMANMQQLFGIQSGIGELKYTEATEACQTRNQAMLNTRDIIDNQRDGNQKIIDKLCQLELDNERAQRAADQREIARLNSELMYARGQASQEAQSSDIVRRVLAEMRSCPVPAQPVYGNTPIFTCNGNNGGCGCNGNGFGTF